MGCTWLIRWQVAVITWSHLPQLISGTPRQIEHSRFFVPIMGCFWSPNHGWIIQLSELRARSMLMAIRITQFISTISHSRALYLAVRRHLTLEKQSNNSLEN